MDNAFFAKLRQAAIAMSSAMAVDLPLVIVAVQAVLQLLVEKLST